MEGNKKEVVEGKQKKSKTALVAIITLIVGLVLGVGGSYYYFEVMNNDKTNVNEEEKNTQNKEENKTVKYENLDVLSDIVQNNFNKFMRAANYFCGTQREYFKSTKITSSNIDNKVAYSTVSTYFFNNKGNISAEEFEKAVKMYFGKDYKYQHQDFTSKICTDHHYNSSTNSYEYVEPACGGTCGPYGIEYRITKAELVDDKMVLNIKVLFPGNDTDRDNNGHVKYYSDANLTKQVSDLTYDWRYGDTNDEPIFNNDENLAKGGNYKFVMQKYDDNNYSFVSSEPIA